jgi:hypothetical protein
MYCYTYCTMVGGIWRIATWAVCHTMSRMRFWVFGSARHVKKDFTFFWPLMLKIVFWNLKQKISLLSGGNPLPGPLEGVDAENLYFFRPK